MKFTLKTLVLLILCVASIAVADDFKTIDGKEYKNVTVSRVEPDGITVKNTKAGVIVKLYFTELPKDVQQRFNYDPQQGATYQQEREQRRQELNEAREEATRQKEEATRRNNEQLGKEQAGIQWTQEQRQKIQALQNRYADLQQKEDDLVERIREAKHEPVGSTRHPIIGSQRRELPSLQSSLSDVRREKADVKQQLEQLQH